jgi:3D (Asp-Asp-Asp) domain-containing protein
MKKQILAVLFALILLPVLALAEEKKGTVAGYDEGSRMVTIKGKDWEQKAKVSSKASAADKALLKEGTKVMVEFDDRGGGDVRVKSIGPR